MEARIQTFTETKGSCGFRKKNPRQRHSNHRIGVSGHAWLSLSFHVLSLNATIWTREQRLKKASSCPSVGGGEAVNLHRNVRHTWSARRHARMRRETCKKKKNRVDKKWHAVDSRFPEVGIQVRRRQRQFPGHPSHGCSLQERNSDGLCSNMRKKGHVDFPLGPSDSHLDVSSNPSVHAFR